MSATKKSPKKKSKNVKDFAFYIDLLHQAIRSGDIEWVSPGRLVSSNANRPSWSILFTTKLKMHCLKRVHEGQELVILLFKRVARGVKRLRNDIKKSALLLQRDTLLP